MSTLRFKDRQALRIAAKAVFSGTWSWHSIW